jgi:hypothetical protein
MIVLLNGLSGLPDSSFSTDGIEIIGHGTGLDLAHTASRVMALGTISGNAAGIGGSGTWDASTGWFGYLLAITTQGASAGVGSGNGGWVSNIVQDVESSGCGSSSLAFLVISLVMFGFVRRRKRARR